MNSKLILITLFHVYLFILEIQSKVYGGGLDSYDDDYGNYGHVRGGNHVVPVVKKIVDYYSKPQYAFGYEVDDYYNKLSHGRWEVRDGDVTQGQYRVLLPDGRIQIVSYIADKGGYRPTVTYIGKGHHPPPPPAYAHVRVPPQIQHVHYQPAPSPPPHILHEQPFILPSPTPIPVIKSLEHGGPYGHQPPSPSPPQIIGGPFKLDLSPHSGGFVPSGPGPYGANPTGNYGDLLIYGPSSNHHETIKITPNKLAKKRELMYDRSPYRRDLPMKRKLIKRKIQKYSTLPTSTSTSTTTTESPLT